MGNFSRERVVTTLISGKVKSRDRRTGLGNRIRLGARAEHSGNMSSWELETIYCERSDGCRESDFCLEPGLCNWAQLI